MFALIMAGGKASRLGMGEKALARIGDRPLISYVLTAVIDAGLSPIVIVSPLTPYTTNYCRVQNIEWICTDGRGYVEDIGQAVTELSITGPVLTICADLPGITAKHIKTVLDRYNESGCPACSVWVESAADNFIRSSGTLLSVDNEKNSIPGIPVGLNIIQGDLIAEEQDEIQIILSDPLLVLNINTRDDLVAD